MQHLIIQSKNSLATELFSGGSLQICTKLITQGASTCPFPCILLQYDASFAWYKTSAPESAVAPESPNAAQVVAYELLANASSNIEERHTSDTDHVLPKQD